MSSVVALALLTAETDMSNIVEWNHRVGTSSHRLEKAVAIVCGLVLWFACGTAIADSVNLAWDRNAETNLSRYTLKYGATSGSYTGLVNIATNSTTATVSNLAQNVTYYFVVTATDVNNQESNPSAEVSQLIPNSSTNAPPTLNALSDLTVNEDAD